MKAIFALWIVGHIFTPSAFGQILEAHGYHIQAGVGFPIAPNKFYDYWRTGPSIGGGVAYPITHSGSIRISAGYARFALDRERYLKWLGLPSEGNSISGASTHIFSIAGDYVYFPPPEPIPIYLFGGVAAMLSSVRPTTATFSDYTASKGTDTYPILSFILGAGLSFKVGHRENLYVECKEYFGLLRNAQANSNFAAIVLGFCRSL